MTAATHRFVIPHSETARPDIAAFAYGLSPDSEFYWPALAAADGCNASLAELNAMLVADDSHPFGAAAYARSTVGMGGVS